ncbi:hypothetical protein BOVAC2_1483 [Bacteroides ovatus]|nr:hypothetical protein BOVAC2_1483 [Bacteroides ovatus]
MIGSFSSFFMIYSILWFLELQILALQVEAFSLYDKDAIVLGFLSFFA